MSPLTHPILNTIACFTVDETDLPFIVAGTHFIVDEKGKLRDIEANGAGVGFLVNGNGNIQPTSIHRIQAVKHLALTNNHQPIFEKTFLC